jgi:hypothetical protein
VRGPETQSSRPGRGARVGTGEGQRGKRLSLQDDQGAEIADVLGQLHADGWNVGDTAFFDVEDGGPVWVVAGTNGENMIRAEGATSAESWRRARPGRGGRDAQVEPRPECREVRKGGRGVFLPVIRVWTAMPCHVAVRRFATNRRAIGSG